MSLNLHGANSDGQSIKNLPSGSSDTVNATIANRLPGIAAMIRGEKIDVFGVQEARELAGTANWITALDEELDEFSRAGEAKITTLNTSEGNCIYYRTSKYRLVDENACGTFWLVEGAPTSVTTNDNYKVDGCANDRICSWALLECIATGECFLFMNTHLDTAGDAVTNQQATVIVNEIADILSAWNMTSDCPVILVGDMNSESTTNTYKTLTSQLTDSCVKVNSPYENYNTGYGYNYVDPNNPSYRIDGHRIDYILVSDAATVIAYDMIHAATNLCPYKAGNGDGYITDHNAVIAQIAIGDGE